MQNRMLGRFFSAAMRVPVSTVAANVVQTAMNEGSKRDIDPKLRGGLMGEKPVATLPFSA